MGIDQIERLYDGNVYIDDGYVYAEGTQPGDKSDYSKSELSDSIYVRGDSSFTIVTPSSGQRHVPEYQEDFLTAEPDGYNEVSTHRWIISNPEFGVPGENGDEIDTIEIEYENSEFGGIPETDVTVEMVRTLGSGKSRDEIGLNSGTYSGNSAVLDLSGFSQTDAAGPIEVTIPEMQNAAGPETATLTLVGDAEDKVFQGLFPEADPRALAPETSFIVHVDVGQADASIVRTPTNETVVIDTGSELLPVLLALESLEVDEIDHLVSTHAHTDHIGGAESLIKEYENNREGVGAVWDNGVTTGSQTYANYIDTVEQFDIDLFLPRRGDEIPTSGLTAKVLNPKQGELNSIQHDNSVTIRVDAPSTGKSWLVTGDANETAESDMVSDVPSELSADVYQVGHHGSTTSSTQEFLDEVSPSYGVISAPIDSQFDHPEDAVLDRLDSNGIQCYWTAKHGDIELVLSEPEEFETGSQFSTDPVDFKAEKQ